MKLRRISRIMLLARFALLVVFLASCRNAGEQAIASVPHTVIPGWDTLVTSRSGLIGHAGSMALDGDDRLWITDRLNHQIVVIAHDSVVMVIGREGTGPGEFRTPSSLSITDSTVFVFDFGNRRMIRFSVDGTYKSEAQTPSPAFFPLDVNDIGDVALPTLGLRNSLVEVRRLDGMAFFAGEPRANMPPSISRPRIREQVRRGDTPVEFRNNVLPVLTRDRGVWLILQSYGTLERYDSLGTLVFATSLPAAHINEALRRFSLAWDGHVEGVPVPWMARDGAEVDDELWLLTDEPGGDGAAILVLAANDGAPKHLLIVPVASHASAFAVDNRRRYLYLYLPEDASILRVPLQGR